MGKAFPKWRRNFFLSWVKVDLQFKQLYTASINPKYFKDIQPLHIDLIVNPEQQCSGFSFLIEDKMSFCPQFKNGIILIT